MGGTGAKVDLIPKILQTDRRTKLYSENPLLGTLTRIQIHFPIRSRNSQTFWEVKRGGEK